MGTREEVKLMILSILLNSGEVDASTLEKKAGCSNKTFLKARRELEEGGYITKRYEPRQGGGPYAFYSITKRGREYYEKEVVKKTVGNLVDKTEPNEIERLKRMLENMECELKHYKRLNEIHKLENMPLPLVVLRKMLGEERAREFANVFDDGRGVDGLPPELREVEVKTVSVDEYFRTYERGPGWKVLKNNIKEVKTPLGKEGIEVIRYEGTVTVGRYKELFRLYAEEFEYEWLKWKKEFQLSDDDWMRIGPFIVHELLFEAGRVNLQFIIGNLLYRYILSGKPNGEEELKQFVMKIYRYEEGAAKKEAKRIVEEFKELRNQPIEKIWSGVEKEVDLFHAGSQPLFNYLKNKYVSVR